MGCNNNIDGYDCRHRPYHGHGRHQEHWDEFDSDRRYDRRYDRRFERRFERRDDRHDDKHRFDRGSDFRRYRSDRPFFFGFPRLF